MQQGFCGWVGYWHFWYKCFPWKIEQWKKYHRSIKRMAPRSSVLHLCGVLEQCKGWCLTLICVCQWKLQIGISVESIFLGTWRYTRWELLFGWKCFKPSVHQFGLRITGSPTCNLSRLINSYAMSNVSEGKDITSYVSEEDFLLDLATFCPSSNGIWRSCWWLSMEWKKHSMLKVLIIISCFKFFPTFHNTAMCMWNELVSSAYTWCDYTLAVSFHFPTFI